MHKRLLPAAMAIALCALAVPANARPHLNDDDEGSQSYRQRQHDRYERDDDDDEERSYRRERRRRQAATRQRSGTQAQRKAPHPAAKPQQVAAVPPRGITMPELQLLTPAPRAAESTPQKQAKNDGRGCLKPTARALLDRIEAQFGPMQLVSTCRPGARIAGSGRISKHASGEAIDFNAGRRKGDVVRWLIANHKSGGTMTYAGMGHIHVDVGQHFVALNSGSGR
jgi:Peptidase M15